MSPSIECKCTYNFTCRYCLGLCVDRNMADRNNSPLAWTQPSPYSEIKRSLTDFHIALEAARQRVILDRALAALGSGRSEEASRIIKELSNPGAGRGTI